MKKLWIAISTTVVAVLLAYIPPATAATATITLLNAPPTDLAAGESYTVDIQVVSDAPFHLAIALGDAEFPAYLLSSVDVAQNATSAVLHLTFTGNRSTAELPGGVTAAGIAVGIIYAGGERISQRFDFTVAVH